MNDLEKRINEFRLLDNRHTDVEVALIKYGIIKEYNITQDIFETIHYNLVYGQPQKRLK